MMNDVYSVVKSECPSPEKWAEVLEHLDLKEFQDWAYTLAGLDYYLDQLTPANLNELDLEHLAKLNIDLQTVQSIVEKTMDNK